MDDAAKGELQLWWMEQAAKEVEATVPKAIEYSAVDLDIMGAAMESMGAAGEGDGVEAAIAFYALGKLSRIVGALSEGRTPSRDSWFDLGVYARMAQRVIEFGAWPGVAKAPESTWLRHEAKCCVPFSTGEGNRVCEREPNHTGEHRGPVVV